LGRNPNANLDRCIEIFSVVPPGVATILTEVTHPTKESRCLLPELNQR